MEVNPRAKDPLDLAEALAAGKKVGADAIGLLLQDHREAEALFDWCRRAADPGAVLRKLAAALKAHMEVEEEIFYPAVRSATGEQDLVGHSEKEHAAAKRLLAEVEGGATDKLDALFEAVKHHVDEEETRLFPMVRAATLDLYALGRMMAARRLELLSSHAGKTLPGRG